MDGGVPFTRVEHVMAAIRRDAAGRPGERMPSLRRMAVREGVSKSTVVEAYDRLVAEGVIVSRPGAGFFAAARAAVREPAIAARPRERTIDPLWVMRQSLEARAGDLRPGCGWLPDDWLPVEAVRRALRRLARADEAALAGYAPPQGPEGLREALAALLTARTVPARPEAILVTESASRALDLACRLVVAPGDAVLVDDPCYFNFRSLLAMLGARPVGVPMTPTGPDLAAFNTLATEHRPVAYLTNATLQNPTGASLAPDVAHRLLTLAQAHGLTIVEDDIFADFEDRPGPRLAALDAFERVIHIGSFSKTLTASARCGFIAAKADRIEALTDLQLATGFGCQHANGRLLHALLVDGGYRRHVEGLRLRLARAMRVTLERIEACDLTPWLVPRGGMFVWASLPDGVASAAVARRALSEGVVLAPGNVFSVSGSAEQFLRFNVAQCADPRIFEVLHRAIAAERP